MTARDRRPDRQPSVSEAAGDLEGPRGQTGHEDAEPVARAVAAELGIDQVFAGVRPEDKSGAVASLQILSCRYYPDNSQLEFWLPAT